MPHLRVILCAGLAAAAAAALPALASAQSTGQDTTGRHVTTDTSNGAMSGRSRNQDQSGVTNSTTGKSTLGSNVKKTTPTAGAAVTAKGDTLKQAGSTKAAHRTNTKMHMRDSTGMRDSTPH